VSQALDSSQIAGQIHDAGLSGTSAEAIAKLHPKVSRSTINRRLASLVALGTLRQVGSGSATRYVSATPFTEGDIEAFFSSNWQERPSAFFREPLLAPDSANIASDQADRLTKIQALAQPMDARFLTSFLVQFAFGSSVLEGSTYSALDTQALIQYNEVSQGKPVADAVLILNQKRAIEYLWTALEDKPGRSLVLADVCAMHALVTDDHGVVAAAGSDHFLPEHERGVPREHQEVNLGDTAYVPPFKPATGYSARMLERIIETARDLHPVQASLYLMTRIPYLQAFAKGNKRTARLCGNFPLVQHGLIPLSFADVPKAAYIRAMACFYELGDIQLIEKVFIDSCVKSIIRASALPLRMLKKGVNSEAVAAQLAHFVRTRQEAG
jgi:Fic family protein